MKLELVDAKKWINLFVEKVQANKANLNELDTAIGDGDHGTNMDRGMNAIKDSFAKKDPENVADLYKATAFAMIQKLVELQVLCMELLFWICLRLLRLKILNWQI